MKLKEKESEIQRAILEYLAYNKIMAWRNNVGTMAGEYKGRKWFVRFGLPGISDIIGIYKGRFLAIEVKSAKGIVSLVQQAFIDSINKNGGLAFVAKSLDDVKKNLC